MTDKIIEGYLHPLYAQSFSEIGEPVFLPQAKGWLIKRHIPGSEYFDAMGPYPLFACENWDYLTEDLNNLRDELVSVSLVIGSFSDYSKEQYAKYFDIFYPYKDHYYLDTSVPFDQSISKWSRRDARRALKDVSVDLVTSPDIDLDQWVGLYDNLIKRHNIKGIRAFSRDSFAKQLSVPNTYFFRAWHNQDLVGGNLYYLQGDVAYGHLLALTDEGYRLGASHAIKWIAIQHLSKVVRYINFGGSTGNKQGEISGLDRFKLGWTNASAKSYYCGKILDKQKYDQLVKQNSPGDGGWFPEYRFGDF